MHHVPFILCKFCCLFLPFRARALEDSIKSLVELTKRAGLGTSFLFYVVFVSELIKCLSRTNPFRKRVVDVVEIMLISLVTQMIAVEPESMSFNTCR